MEGGRRRGDGVPASRRTAAASRRRSRHAPGIEPGEVAAVLPRAVWHGSRAAPGKNGRVWFEFPKNTRIGLEQTTGQPAIAHYTIKVAPFDRAALTKRLAELGSAVMPSPDEPDVLRFKDNYGITVELKVTE